MILKKSNLIFLFTNKKSIFYLVIILTSIWFTTDFIWDIYNSTEPLFDYILPWVVIILIIALIVQNYVIYLKYNFYQNKLETIKIPFKNGKCVIEIFPRPKKITPLMKNNIVYIKIRPRKIKCNYILTTDFMLLFCKVTEFVILSRSVKPILIKLNNKYNKYLDINENRIFPLDVTSYEKSTLIVPLTKNIKEFEKIKIIDFKNLMNSLT